jgi:hypothetical protein
MQQQATTQTAKTLIYPERAPPRAPRPVLARPGRRRERKNREPFADLPRYRPVMDDEDGFFGERVAAAYDDPSSQEFDPAVIERTVDVLAGLAGLVAPAGPWSWPSGRDGSPCR